MSAPINVLAVMDDERLTLASGQVGCTDEELSRHDDARAAVAELIEADKEFDRAREGYFVGAPDSAEAYRAWVNAAERRQAALAKARP